MKARAAMRTCGMHHARYDLVRLLAHEHIPCRDPVTAKGRVSDR